MTDRDKIAAALDCIAPDFDGHDGRVRVAFAVFDGLGDDGRELWHEWAARRSKPEAAEDRATWKSCRKRGPITVATLFGIAKDHGWRPESVQTPATKLSAAELKAKAAQRKAAEELEAASQAQRQREAAGLAARQWAEASLDGSSAYLARKDVGNHGGRFADDGALLLPMRDAAGEMVNLQRIAPDGEKRFLPGGRKAGTLHLIGEPAGAPWLLVTEGYATGASVHEATGRPVAVAWDAGNLAHVVRALRGQYPEPRIAIAGDDDRATQARTGKNPGRVKAAEAAKLAQGPAIFPEGLPEAGTDWNDLHQSAGVEEVRRQIEAALQAAQSGKPPTPSRAKKNAPAARQRPAAGGSEASADAGGADCFRVDADGLWFDPPDDGSGSAARPVRVCGPLHVTALARDEHDNGAALLIEFDTPFRAGRRWLMPMAMLAGDGAAYRAELLSQGFMAPTDARRRALLTAYLQSRRPSELVRIVDRVGWHGRAYVLPRETLGDADGERIIFQSDTPIESAFGVRGSLDQWRERVAALCVGNSRLVFAVSCAFAGPLLAWAAGTDGGGFNLVGDSSGGKTTTLRTAASVWGGRGYMQRARSTSNGLEALAAQHSDGLLCLDELAQLDPKEAGDAAYLLANGQGKIRASRTGGARPRLTFRLIYVSAGEVCLAQHMAEANKRAHAGQELRLIDLPADAGAGMGAFEKLHGHADGGALAQHLTRATEATYGSAGRAWLEYLVANTEGLSRTLRERMERAVAIVPELALGQVQRVGRRFALVAAAGELATEAGLTGWAEGEATAAARRCINAWIEARPGGIGLSETAQMLRQARGWFGLHGEARFTDWARADDDHAPKTMNRAGWRKPIKTATGMDELIGWEWYVLPDVFRVEACKGFNEKAVLRLLKERGHLHIEGNRPGFGCSASPPGAAKCMVYRIKSSILGDHDE